MAYVSFSKGYTEVGAPAPAVQDSLSLKSPQIQLTSENDLESVRDRILKNFQLNTPEERKAAIEHMTNFAATLAQLNNPERRAAAQEAPAASTRPHAAPGSSG